MTKRVLRILLATVLAGSGTLAVAQIDRARSTLAKWVETEQIISKEERDWQAGKEVLEQRVELLEAEIASRREKIAEIQAGVAEVRTEERELAARNRGLRGASDSLTRSIAGLEQRTRGLLAVVPDLLARRVEPLSRKIPKNPATTDLSLSERFQNVLGILNEINKLNREIVVTREVRELPGGTTAEVEMLYLGLGQAYYVTPNRDAAGTGRPSRDGWTWTATDEIAEEVAQAIAILENGDVPAYVPLPVEVQ